MQHFYFTRWVSVLCFLVIAWGHVPLVFSSPRPSPSQTPSEMPNQAALKQAQVFYSRGLNLQRKMLTKKALLAYQQALRLNAKHALAHYEIGWSYWLLEHWDFVVEHWQTAEQLGAVALKPELTDYLALARQRQRIPAAPLQRPKIDAMAQGGGWQVRLIARFQRYNAQPLHARDVFDAQVASPKSVQFLPTGQKVYVQALEGYATLVYNPQTLKRIRVIAHRFGAKQAPLFFPDAHYTQRLQKAGAPKPNHHFTGKPVEGVLSHQGRYLWVSLYRRSYDPLSQMPSAISVIDTQTDRIVRVVNTGSIPKFLALSPGQKKLAVVHWGENTVGIIGLDPTKVTGASQTSAVPPLFKHLGEWVVGHRLPLNFGKKVNRDQHCGFCLRGAVFTRDGRHLLVGRMSGGGISVLNTKTGHHVGVVHGSKPSPRHLVLARNGQSVYVSANVSGWVEKFDVETLVQAAHTAKKTIKPSHRVYLGSGVRTIALHPQQNLLLAVVNRRSLLVGLDANTLTKHWQIKANSYPVGLAVSPDGGQVWVTSQGRKLRGGHAVSVYALTQTKIPAR